MGGRRGSARCRDAELPGRDRDRGRSAQTSTAVHRRQRRYAAWAPPLPTHGGGGGGEAAHSMPSVRSSTAPKGTAPRSGLEGSVPTSSGLECRLLMKPWKRSSWGKCCRRRHTRAGRWHPAHGGRVAKGTRCRVVRCAFVVDAAGGGGHHPPAPTADPPPAPPRNPAPTHSQRQAWVQLQALEPAQRPARALPEGRAAEHLPHLLIRQRHQCQALHLWVTAAAGWGTQARAQARAASAVRALSKASLFCFLRTRIRCG